MTKKQRIRRRLKGFLVFLLGLIIIFFISDNQLRPIIRNMAETQARSLSVRVINQAITQALAGENVTYDKLIDLKQDTNGNVTSMNTNIVELNRLKAEITLKVQEELSQTDRTTISIPLGSLLGNDFLIGRGPCIDIQLKLANSVLSEIEYAFESAGINQTLHQINLTISADIYAVIPWYRTTMQVETNFCLAESVIVGTVPDAFTQIYEAQGSEIAENYADYGAQAN